MSGAVSCPSCGDALVDVGGGVRRVRLRGRAAAPRRVAAPDVALSAPFTSSTARSSAVRRRRGGLGAAGAQPAGPRQRAAGGLGTAVAGLRRRSRHALVAALHDTGGAQHHHHRVTRHPGRRRAPGRPRVTPGGDTAGRRVGSAVASAGSASRGADLAAAGSVGGGPGPATCASPSARAVAEPITVAAARARERGRELRRVLNGRPMAAASRRVRPGPGIRLSHRFCDLRSRSARSWPDHASSAIALDRVPRRSVSPRHSARRPDRRHHRRACRGGRHGRRSAAAVGGAAASLGAARPSAGGDRRRVGDRRRLSLVAFRSGVTPSADIGGPAIDGPSAHRAARRPRPSSRPCGRASTPSPRSWPHRRGRSPSRGPRRPRRARVIRAALITWRDSRALVLIRCGCSTTPSSTPRPEPLAHGAGRTRSSCRRPQGLARLARR